MPEDPGIEIKFTNKVEINLVPTRLRITALEIRDYASKASQGRWKIWGMQVMADTAGDSNVDHCELVANARTPAADLPNIRTWNAMHISHWDPTTALAVADLLDWVADAREAIDAVSTEPGQGTEMFLTAEKHAMNIMDAFTKGRG